MEKILIIKEKDYGSKKELLKKIAEALSFPSYFGMNLDALVDCLRDIEKQTNIAFCSLPSDKSADWYRDIFEIIVEASEDNNNINVFCKYSTKSGV